MWAIDEYAADYRIQRGISWEDIKKAALKALDYIQGVLWIKLKGKLLAIEKPSPELKIASIAMVLVPSLNEERDTLLCAIFDGGQIHKIQFDIPIDVEYVPLNAFERGHELFNGLNKFYDQVTSLADKGFTIVHFALEGLMDKMCKLRPSIRYLLAGLKEEGRFINVHSLIREIFNVSIAPLEALESVLEVQIPILGRRASYKEVVSRCVELSKTRGKEREAAYEGMLELATAYVEDNAVMTYLLYLICRNQARGQGR